MQYMIVGFNQTKGSLELRMPRQGMGQYSLRRRQRKILLDWTNSSQKPREPKDHQKIPGIYNYVLHCGSNELYSSLYIVVGAVSHLYVCFMKVYRCVNSNTLVLVQYVCNTCFYNDNVVFAGRRVQASQRNQSTNRCNCKTFIRITALLLFMCFIMSFPY